MTKARDIANLVDSNGDVVTGALDNVPASDNASALTTGTLPDGRFPTTLPAISGANLTGVAPTKATVEALNIDLPAANLTGTVADARISTLTASKLTGSLPAGMGGQLKQKFDSYFNFTVSSTSYQDVTSITITPSSTSSRILCMVHSAGTQSNGANNGGMRILRDSTEIGGTGCYGNPGGIRNIMPMVCNVLDAPVTTSSVVYKCQWQRRNGGGLGTANYGATGTFIVLEILG